MSDKAWFLRLKHNVVARAKRMLYGARWAFVANAGKAEFLPFDILPFDSRYNIYDRDVDKTIQAMLSRKGEDSAVLAKSINEALGRKVMPETREEELLARIANLESEIKMLRGLQ